MQLCDSCKGLGSVVPRLGTYFPPCALNRCHSRCAACRRVFQGSSLLRSRFLPPTEPNASHGILRTTFGTHIHVAESRRDFCKISSRIVVHICCCPSCLDSLLCFTVNRLGRWAPVGRLGRMIPKFRITQLELDPHLSPAFTVMLVLRKASKSVRGPHFVIPS